MCCTGACAACSSAETFKIERRDVDGSRLAMREGRDEIARDGRERQSQMLVAERIEQICCEPAAPDFRKIIGQRRPRTEPFSTRLAKADPKLGYVASETRP